MATNRVVLGSFRVWDCLVQKAADAGIALLYEGMDLK